MKRKLRIGTRGSELALAQAAAACQCLEEARPGLQTEQVIVKTTGDQRLDLRFSEIGVLGPGGAKIDKGLFTKELEQALLAGEIDVAVHSLKDLPTEQPEGLEVGAVLPREDPRDVLITRSAGGLDGLPQGGTVATSSLRRSLQLQRLRPDLQVVEMRGNVPTRLRKLTVNSFLHGILLAAAGLKRLGLDPGPEVLEGDFGRLHAFLMEEEVMLPAAGQGAVALQIRADDPESGDAVGAVNDRITEIRVQAERAFLKGFGGGCHSPLGVRSEVRSENRLFLEGMVFEGQDPSQARRASVIGPADDPLKTAQQLLEAL